MLQISQFISCFRVTALTRTAQSCVTAPLRHSAQSSCIRAFRPEQPSPASGPVSSGYVPPSPLYGRCLPEPFGLHRADPPLRQSLRCCAEQQSLSFAESSRAVHVPRWNVPADAGKQRCYRLHRLYHRFCNRATKTALFLGFHTCSAPHPPVAGFSLLTFRLLQGSMVKYGKVFHTIPGPACLFPAFRFHSAFSRLRPPARPVQLRRTHQCRMNRKN